MYGVIGKIVTSPGDRDGLAAILTALPAMPGCRSYVVAEDRSDPNGLWVTEVWDSAEAHRSSLDLTEVQEAMARGRALIVGFEHRFETTPIAETVT